MDTSGRINFYLEPWEMCSLLIYWYSDEEEEKDDDEVFNPDTAKEKLKMKGEEFEAEHKKKTKELKPHIWGCHWEIEEVMCEENI